MQISLLLEHPDAIEILAPQATAYWQQFSEAESLEKRRAKYRRHLNRNGLPTAWVAHNGKDYFGTAALRICDYDERPNLSPWLGGVFVRPEYRGQGIASMLCEAVCKFARQKGFDSLHLLTLDKQPLYRRMGWRNTEKVTWLGRSASIMVKNLDML